MIADATVALALRMAGSALWLALTVLLARFLDISSFGLVFYAINITLLGGAIGTVGYDVTVLRFGSVYWKTSNLHGFSQILREGRLIAIAAGLIMASALILAAVAGWKTPVTSSLPLALLVASCIVATSLMAVHRDSLRGADRLAQGLFGGTIIRAAVPLALVPALIGAGRLTAMTALLTYLAALCCVLIYEARRLSGLHLPRARRARKVQNLAVAAGIWPGEVSGIVLARTAGVVIGLHGGMEVAALYLAAERLAQLGQVLTDATRMAIGPALARASTPLARRETIARAGVMMFASGMAGTLALVPLGWGGLRLLGPVYVSAYPVVLVLLLAQASWTILGPTTMIMNMAGLEKANSLLNAVAAIVLLAALWHTQAALTGSAVVAAVAWGKNAALWVVIYARTGVRSGIPGLNGSRFKAILSSEWSSALKTLHTPHKRQ